jgi:hypothetical protein
MPYRKLDLGQQGVDYLVRYLEDGRSLAKHLLARADLGRGRVATFLPDTITEVTATQLNFGILGAPPPQTHVTIEEGGQQWTMVPKLSVLFLLAPIIESYLAANAGRVCVFEDTNARATDPWIATADTRLALAGHEVYHFIAGPEATTEEILRTLRSAMDWRLVGILTSIKRPLAQKIEEITESEMAELAANAFHIVAGAYDGEGFVIWEAD